MGVCAIRGVLSTTVQALRHPYANFGKLVLNEVEAAFPNWDTLLRWHAQEL
jgi:hypothetical protein